MNQRNKRRLSSADGIPEFGICNTAARLLGTIHRCRDLRSALLEIAIVIDNL